MKYTINQHISQLLYRHECVVVPEFGAFLTRSYPAELNRSINMLRPAWRQVVFNGRISENDGLLAKHIATTEGTTYKAALEAVHVAVNNWQRILRAGKKVNLAGVGRLFLDEEGTLQFNPAQDVNYDIHSYGLFIFRANAIEREEKFKQSVNRALETRGSMRSDGGNKVQKTGKEKMLGITHLVRENRRQISRWAAVLGPVVALGLVGSYLYTQQPAAVQQAAGYVQNVLVSQKDTTQGAEESTLFDSGFSEVESSEQEEKKTPVKETPSAAEAPKKTSHPDKNKAGEDFVPNETPYEPTELDANINHSLYNVKPRPGSTATQSAAADPHSKETGMAASDLDTYSAPERGETDAQKTGDMERLTPFYGPSLDGNFENSGADSDYPTQGTSPALELAEEAQKGDIDLSADSQMYGQTSAQKQASEPASQLEAAPYYQIIVGSFTQEANAQEYKQTLEEKGFAAYLAPADGHIRVALGKFSSETGARQQLPNIRQALTDGAWVKGGH